MVNKSHITTNDKFDFENRLREIVNQLVKPVYDKLSATQVEQQKLKMNMTKQERALAENIEWIKSRGDPNEI